MLTTESNGKCVYSWPAEVTAADLQQVTDAASQPASQQPGVPYMDAWLALRVFLLYHFLVYTESEFVISSTAACSQWSL